MSSASVDSGRRVAAIAAAAFFIAGIVGIASSWATGAWIFLLALSALCVILVVLAPRMVGQTTIEVGPKGITLKTNLAPEVVAEVRAGGFDAAAATYTFIHTQLADDAESQALKIKLQDELVKVAVDLAATGKITPDQISAAIKSGQPATRPLAFGVLAANPQWAELDLLVQGIGDSLTANEQYHALRAANAAWPKLAATERRTLQATVRKAEWLAGDNDRRTEAGKLLAHPLND